MVYEILGRVSASSASILCTESAGNATISATLEEDGDVWITWVADTDYSIDAGNEASDFSFRGPNPHDSLISLLSDLPDSYEDLLSLHLEDYRTVFSGGNFSLNIGQSADLETPTSTLIEEYTTEEGNPYLEWLLFQYGRYMLVSSARGILPANLQGKWAKDIGNPWSAGVFNHMQAGYVC